MSAMIERPAVTKLILSALLSSVFFVCQSVPSMAADSCVDTLKGIAKLTSQADAAVIEQYENILRAAANTPSGSGGAIALQLKIKQLEKKLMSLGATPEDIANVRTRAHENMQKVQAETENEIRERKAGYFRKELLSAAIEKMKTDVRPLSLLEGIAKIRFTKDEYDTFLFEFYKFLRRKIDEVRRNRSSDARNALTGEPVAILTKEIVRRLHEFPLSDDDRQRMDENLAGVPEGDLRFMEELSLRRGRILEILRFKCSTGGPDGIPVNVLPDIGLTHDERLSLAKEYIASKFSRPVDEIGIFGLSHEEEFQAIKWFLGHPSDGFDGRRFETRNLRYLFFTQEERFELALVGKPTRNVEDYELSPEQSHELAKRLIDDSGVLDVLLFRDQFNLDQTQTFDLAMENAKKRPEETLSQLPNYGLNILQRRKVTREARQNLDRGRGTGLSADGSRGSDAR